MNRTVSRRLGRLETQAARIGRAPFSCRILLVDAVEGATGALVLDSNGVTSDAPTPEEKERIDAELATRRAARK
jgi:hypothetical protein